MTVSFIPQIAVGFCGAACAQMVLNSRGLIGTTEAEQRRMWTEIKNHTSGGPTLPQGSDDPSPCEPVSTFPQKICEECGKKTSCWCTHPAALRDTLLSYLNNFAVRIIKRADEDDATERVEACLANGLAPVVLVKAGSHWVVVDEIDRNAKYPVSLLNPALSGQKGIKLSYWRNHYLQSPPCGKFEDVHVVVGADQ